MTRQHVQQIANKFGAEQIHNFNNERGILMKTMKAIIEEIQGVDKELETLQNRKVELEQKIAGLQDVPDDVPPDELSTITEFNSEASAELQSKIAHIEAARSQLELRRKVLQQEEHEAKSVEVSREKIKLVKQIYADSIINNKLVQQLQEVRQRISINAAKSGMSSLFTGTSGYDRVSEYPFPTMPRGIGQSNLADEAGGRSLLIPLTPAMIEAAQAKN